MSHGDRAARYSDLFEPAGSAGQSNCAYCPICAAIGAVRTTRPEILDHLAAAARELIVAAGLFIDEADRIVRPQDDEPPRMHRIDSD